jgi:hypothetical protein
VQKATIVLEIILPFFQHQQVEAALALRGGGIDDAYQTERHGGRRGVMTAAIVNTHGQIEAEAAAAEPSRTEGKEGETAQQSHNDKDSEHKQRVSPSSLPRSSACLYLAGRAAAAAADFFHEPSTAIHPREWRRAAALRCGECDQQ